MDEDIDRDVDVHIDDVDIDSSTLEAMDTYESDLHDEPLTISELKSIL